jgi:hypothetical protein
MTKQIGNILLGVGIVFVGFVNSMTTLSYKVYWKLGITVRFEISMKYFVGPPRKLHKVKAAGPPKNCTR